MIYDNLIIFTYIFVARVNVITLMFGVEEPLRGVNSYMYVGAHRLLRSPAKSAIKWN